MVFTAMTLAAYLGYAATRNVQIPWKRKKKLYVKSQQDMRSRRCQCKTYAILKNTVAIMGTIQCTDEYVVKANQKSATVSMGPPTIAGGNRSSGCGL